MPEKILVTSYTNPDLDGTACAFGYAEFLRKQGYDAVAGLFGSPHREAQFVLDKFNIKKIADAELLIRSYPNMDIVLVDASDVEALPKFVEPKQVIQVIDHRKFHEAENFPNAKIQIERVGACGTLIAEKFHKSQIIISKESAILLYSAIVSNTINFQGDVTTDRDKKMAEWLKSQIELPENYIREMFTYKSNFTQPLKEILLFDFKSFQINGRGVGIAQLEMINVDGYIKKNLEEIKKALCEIKQQKSLNYVFLSCIDLEFARNTFAVIDEDSKKLVEFSLGVEFNDSVAKSNHIIMRKKVVPLIEKVLKQTHIEK